MRIQEFAVTLWHSNLRGLAICLFVCAVSTNSVAQTQDESSDSASDGAQKHEIQASNPLERAIELNANGMFAEAALSFDELHQEKPI